MASMTIRITEDDDPKGIVDVDYDIEGFDIATARVNGDLPVALQLGAHMLRLVQDAPGPKGEPVPGRGRSLNDAR